MVRRPNHPDTNLFEYNDTLTKIYLMQSLACTTSPDTNTNLAKIYAIRSLARTTSSDANTNNNNLPSPTTTTLPHPPLSNLAAQSKQDTSNMLCKETADSKIMAPGSHANGSCATPDSNVKGSSNTETHSLASPPSPKNLSSPENLSEHSTHAADSTQPSIPISTSPKIFYTLHPNPNDQQETTTRIMNAPSNSPDLLNISLALEHNSQKLSIRMAPHVIHKWLNGETNKIKLGIPNIFKFAIKTISKTPPKNEKVVSHPLQPNTGANMSATDDISLIQN
eukprot:jgi/Psemu1/24923/gm1.24923_g